MDIYPSNRPPVDDTGLSGGVSFKFANQIGVQKMGNSTLSFNYQQQKTSGQATYTVDICVDGVAKKLDVYVAKPPY